MHDGIKHKQTEAPNCEHVPPRQPTKDRSPHPHPLELTYWFHCSAERLGQSQGCISSCVCLEVLHHVEMEMRGMQVSVDGYNMVNSMTSLTVHH